MRQEPDYDKLLSTDAVELAAHSFVAAFTGVKLGQEVASGKVAKWLKQEFGSPRWGESDTTFSAVMVEIHLIFEQARVAGRQPAGPLILLPRGVRLLEAPDPVAALREFL
jgi:hypothetical protein